jgi:peptide/nickel transport system permease protein
MLGYIIRRSMWAIPTLAFVSFISFLIIQLPPGDFVTAYVAQLRNGGEYITDVQEALMREQYGLNDPLLVQYWRWITNIIFYGDFGRSLEWNAPVSSLIWERLGLTLILSTVSLVFTWIIAIPVGVYSATRQYSAFDYIFTVFGFLGKGVPDFLLALILMWVAFIWMNLDVGGLISPQFEGQPWGVAKTINMLSHVWIPLVVLATGGAAGTNSAGTANSGGGRAPTGTGSGVGANVQSYDGKPSTGNQLVDEQDRAVDRKVKNICKGC